MIIRKVLQPFYTTWVLLTFLVSLLLAFPFFLIISLGNSIAARRTLYYIIKYWSKCWLFIIGMPVKVNGQMPGKDIRYVIISNHISYIDSITIFPAIPSYFRALGKKEMSAIPIFGFLYKQLVVMVDRSSAYSRAKSMRLMWRVLKHESNIIVFPEGTFNEGNTLLKDFYDGAFRLAINAQTDIMPMLLIDTLNRWHYSAWWKIWPGPNRVLFLPAEPVKGLTLDDLPILKQKVYHRMESELKKYRQLK
jgi:1-acyl-sn-glycerol-3-phosphate acyltransferase